MVFDFDAVVPRRGSESVKWDEYGPDVLPAWVADMDFQASPAILAALQRRLLHGVFGYELVPQDYFDAVASWFSRRHGWEGITREMIVPTTGVIPAYSAAIKAFTRPGDGVIVQTPCYNAFFPAIRNNGCREMRNPLRCVRGRYEMDYDGLETLAADPRNTVLLLCNPHNPVGRVWTREELLRVGEICLRHGVFVISDEIHCELTRPGLSYVPWATLPPEMVRRSVTCCSPTKAFNIAGIQIANLIASDSSVVYRVDRAINDNECCDVNVFGVAALKAAYNESEAWLDALRDYLWENEARVRSTLSRELPWVTMPALEGTYLMWLDCTGLPGAAASVSEGCLLRETPFSGVAASLRPLPPSAASSAEADNLHLAGPSPCPCPGVDTLPEQAPSSAAAAAPPVLPENLSDALADHLRTEAHVALSSGAIYGAPEGFLRLNIACPQATLREVLTRLVAGLRSFSC